MGTTRTRQSLIALSAAAVAGLGAAALPTISPVAATSVATSPTCQPPAPAGGSPAPVELSRTTTSSGTLVISGQTAFMVNTLGCRIDGAEVARIEYDLFKAPKSNRWLAYVGSMSYGGKGVAIDYAVPQTERQFDRARKQNHARTEVRLPKVKGTVFVTRDQAPVFTTFAKKVNGKKPTDAKRAAAADKVLLAGDPFRD